MSFPFLPAYMFFRYERTSVTWLEDSYSETDQHRFIQHLLVNDSYHLKLALQRVTMQGKKEVSPVRLLFHPRFSLFPFKSHSFVINRKVGPLRQRHFPHFRHLFPSRCTFLDELSYLYLSWCVRPSVRAFIFCLWERKFTAHCPDQVSKPLEGQGMDKVGCPCIINGDGAVMIRLDSA